MSEETAAMAEDKPAKEAPSHPSYLAMVVEAIEELGDKKGSSRKAVSKHVLAKYPELVPEKAAVRLKLAFRSGIAKEKLVLAKSKGKGAGSYKVAKEEKKPAKKTEESNEGDDEDEEAKKLAAKKLKAKKLKAKQKTKAAAAEKGENTAAKATPKKTKKPSAQKAITTPKSDKKKAAKKSAKSPAAKKTKKSAEKSSKSPAAKVKKPVAKKAKKPSVTE